jgi:hypothetical protein
MKDRLIFDTTDANTIAESDSVGAFVRSSDGTLITHTTVGGREALDVYIAEGINVEVDLDAADDSVAAWLNDGTGNAIGSTGGALHISDAGGSITVDAVDLDIRDLTAASDSIAISDGTDTLAVNADGSINSVVTATDLDIRDLTAASDSVQAWAHDGAGTALTSTLVGADQALDVNVVNDVNINDAALANAGIANAANTLTTASTAQDAVASPLADRKYLFIYNNDNRTMFVGGTGVTEANGFPVSPGSYLELRAGASIDLEFVSPKSSHAIRTLELA